MAIRRPATSHGCSTRTVAQPASWNVASAVPRSTGPEPAAGPVAEEDHAASRTRTPYPGSGRPEGSLDEDGLRLGKPPAWRRTHSPTTSPVTRSTTPCSSCLGSGRTSCSPLLRVSLTAVADRVGVEASGLLEGQQPRDRVPVLHRRVEPRRPVLALEHQRLPVVDPVQPWLGLGRDDREGHQPGVRVLRILDGLVPPELVQPGERHRLPVDPVDVERLLARLALGVGRRRRDLPLVPPVGRDQAPPRHRRTRESRLVQDRLGAGVDHPDAGLGVLGPAGHQPPGEQPQLPQGYGVLLSRPGRRRRLGAGRPSRRPGGPARRPRLPAHRPGQHDQRLLGRRHVEVRLPRRRALRVAQHRPGGPPRLVDLDVELLDDLGLVLGCRVPTTHGRHCTKATTVSP